MNFAKCLRKSFLQNTSRRTTFVSTNKLNSGTIQWNNNLKFTNIYFLQQRNFDIHLKTELGETIWNNVEKSSKIKSTFA